MRRAGLAGEKGGCRLCAGSCGEGVDRRRFGRGVAGAVPGPSLGLGLVGPLCLGDGSDGRVFSVRRKASKAAAPPLMVRM